LDIYCYLICAIFVVVILDIFAIIFKKLSKSGDDNSYFFENTYVEHLDDKWFIFEIYTL
jgi:hypothetical protein